MAGLLSQHAFDNSNEPVLPSDTYNAYNHKEKVNFKQARKALPLIEMLTFSEL